MSDINPLAIVVVWKKTHSSNKKYMTVFNNANIDQINTNRAKTPVIPNESPFLDVGMGASFVNSFMKKHKIKKYQLNTKPH
mgnify:CR=1 FL=1